MKDKTTLEQLVTEEINASIWRTPAVADQPSINLIRWSVMETQMGSRHLLGYNADDREGRVSTAITSFDAVTGRATTKSGRVYQLRGPAGYDPDGIWVWNIWSARQGLEGHDVTGEYIALLRECPTEASGTAVPSTSRKEDVNG